METIDVMEEITMTANVPVIKMVTATATERKAVADFVRREYQRRMEVEAPIPNIVFAAFQGDEVVGTMGLEFQESDGRLPCEHVFAFDPAELVLPLDRQRTVQYSRWTVARGQSRVVVKNIIIAITKYALRKGKRYGFCELKPAVARVVAAFNIVLYEVPHSTIVPEAIHCDVLRYYTTQPYPALYQLDLRQVLAAVTKEK